MTFKLFSFCATLFCLGWFFYRLLIKRDLRHHLEEVRIGAFFIAVWAIIWWLAWD